MKRLHIIGRKNHGKTTLVVELLEEFCRRGLHVGAIKHTHHDHELDVPGKDSHKHRVAGAQVVGVLSRSMSALFLPAKTDGPTNERYEAMAPAFADCAFVLVEGDIEAPAPKIEVWRAERGTPPIGSERDDVLAMVTDDASSVDVPALPRSNVPALADWIANHFA